MYEIEYRDVATGELIRKEVRSVGMAREMGKAIAKSIGKCVIVRRSDQRKYQAWVWLPEEERWQKVDKEMTRAECAEFWKRAVHPETLPVMIPAGTTPPPWIKTA